VNFQLLGVVVSVTMPKRNILALLLKYTLYDTRCR